MSEELAERRCEPCEKGGDPLRPDQVEALMRAIHADWSLSEDGRSISRRFEFRAYDESLGFANAAAWIAISEDHHPDLKVSYGSCEVRYSTHAVNGLSDNDFICAAKTDRLISKPG